MKTLRSPSSGNALADEGYEHFRSVIVIARSNLSGTK